MGLLCIFAATLIFLIAYGEGEGKDYRELLETDDAIILLVVMTRYVMQIVRLISVIRKVRINRKVQNEMKKIDLNDIEINKNKSLNYQNVHEVDEIVRKKMM